MKKTNKINQVLLALLALLAVTSCSSTEDVNENENLSQSDKLFQVSAFPKGFIEDGTTRYSTANFKKGKTSWENGDTIYVRCQAYNDETCTGSVQATIWYVLKYTDLAWSTKRIYGNATWSEYKGMRITSYYAPNFEFSTKTDSLELKAGKIPGTAEFLTSTMTVTTATKDISAITFSRNYSRLRIYCLKNSKITINAGSGSFVPACGIKNINAYTTMTDDSCNAFLYGTWNKDETFSVICYEGQTPYWMKSFKQSGGHYNLGAQPVNGQSYAINAYPTSYNTIGIGTADNPYLIFTKEQIISLLDKDYGKAFYKNDNGDKPHYKLCRDLNIQDYTFFNESGWFEGIFDGNFHTVAYRHAIDDSYFSTSYYGLFPGVKGNFSSSNPEGNYGIVKNLTVSVALQDSFETKSANNSYVGVLIGYLDGGLVMNCKSNIFRFELRVDEGAWKMHHCGGLIGYAEDSYIVESGVTFNELSAASNTKSFYQGGLVGESSDCYINHCYVTGDMRKHIKGFSDRVYIGGMAGSASDSKFENSFTNIAFEWGEYANLFTGKGDDNTYLNCYARQRVWENSYIYHPVSDIPFEWKRPIDNNTVYFEEENDSIMNCLNAKEPSQSRIYSTFKSDLKDIGFKMIGEKIKLKWEK